MPDGSLASGDSHGRIKIWDTSTGELLNSINAHYELVQSMTILRDGSLVSASSNGEVKVWQ